MTLSRYLDPRKSFAAKLALAVLGTVGLLLVVMLLAVQAETRGQVERVSEDAVARARRAFEESERLRQEQLARRASVFIATPRRMALLEAAIEAADTAMLVDQISYDLQLSQFGDSALTVLTDPDGTPIVTLTGRTAVVGEDPLDMAPIARRLLEEYASELTVYRRVGDRLYTIRMVPVELGARVVGTAAFGQPIRNEDAVAISNLVGAEVCFVAGQTCVAGTPEARSELADPLTTLGATSRRMTERNGDRWELVSEPLPGGGSDELRLAMALPLEPFLTPFDRIRRTLALGALGALVLALVLGTVLARGLARPIGALVAATGRVGRGDYDTRVPEDSADEVGQLARAFNTMTEGLALKEQYRGVLDKVVSRDVAEELLRGDLTLGGESREVTVLFADIRGFTTLTEGMAPQAVIGLLNETMERLGTVVEREGGVVDKYVGDEIMAVFGAPLRQGDHAARAVRAAVTMQASMAELSSERKARGEPAVGIGIGLHTGEAVAGNMGSPSRLNYTVVGESVNLASRLCSVAAPGQILISGATRAGMDPTGEVRAHPSGARELKGFSRSVDVFEVSAGVGPGGSTLDPARASGP